MEYRNDTLNGAFLTLLKPLVRLFLRYGRGIREFNELAKTAFVDVASEDYGVGGRPTNASRIAAMTGITRREIRRLRSKIANGYSESVDQTTPVRDVVSAWRTDPEFLDESGQPAVLPLSGEQGTFHALVKRYAGDIPEGAMRKELERTAGAEAVDDALRLPDPSQGMLVGEHRLANDLLAGPCALLSAVAQNHLCDDPRDTWPIESLHSRSIRQSDVKRVRQIVSSRLRATVANIAELLEAYTALHENEVGSEPRTSISAGVFYTEGVDVPPERESASERSA